MSIVFGFEIVSFGSPIANLEPKLQLFEVGDDGIVTNCHNQLHQLWFYKSNRGTKRRRIIQTQIQNSGDMKNKYQ